MIRLEGRNYGRFGRFLLAGGFAAVVNIVSRIGFDLFMPYEVAIVFAYGIGLTTAFLLNRRFVFTSAGDDRTGQYLRFALVNLAALAQVWVVSVLFARVILPAIGWEWHAELVAHVIGVASPAVTSYYAHKWFTFRAV